MAKVAELLGTPLMPWQQLVADVALEVDDDGIPFYREVVFSTPRQSGKSSLLLALQVDRCLANPLTQVAYSAQTGWDARRKLIEDQVPVLERSELKKAVQRVYRGAANESVLFRTGSKIVVLASTPTAGHGKTLDMSIIDEAFADIDDRREQSMVAAMATRRGAQMFITSTAGTDESVYWNRKVEIGRSAATDDLGRGVAYFEWSGTPEQLADPQRWPEFHPALGHTIDESVMAHAQASMDPAGFARAWGNITDRQASDRPIPLPVWQRIEDDTAAPAGALVWGVDVSPDRSSAAIVSADSTGAAELVEHRDGAAWVEERIFDLHGRWGGKVALDARGPAGSLTKPLKAAGIDVSDFSAAQMAEACGRLLDRVADRQIRVRPHESFTAALAGAVRRHSGDVWVWGRRSALADVCPLPALTVALDVAITEEPAYSLSDLIG